MAHIEQMLAVPGLGFAECGPGDLHMSYGVERVAGQHDPRVIEAAERVRAACAANGVAFLEVCTPDNVTDRIDRGVRVVSGGREEIARIGRAHTEPHAARGLTSADAERHTLAGLRPPCPRFNGTLATAARRMSRLPRRAVSAASYGEAPRKELTTSVPRPAAPSPGYLLGWRARATARGA